MVDDADRAAGVAYNVSEFGQFLADGKQIPGIVAQVETQIGRIDDQNV